MTTPISTQKTWSGPVAHLSKTLTGGGAASCGNRKAHMTLSKAAFSQEPIAGRCELCQRIHKSRGGY